jgi:hypothetical protein
MKILNIVINVINESNKWKEVCLSCMHFWPKLENQRPHKRKNGFFLFPVIGVLVFGSFLILTQGSSYAAQVKLAWNASNGAAGYKIYYGTSSNHYTSVVDVKNYLTYTFTNLPDGNTYYFAATAYDTSRLESDYSTEVCYNAISSYPSILWRNTSTGQVALWYMNGTSSAGFVYIGVVSLDWTIVGRADFNSDGKPDIIWRNPTTGDNYIWYMDGTSYKGNVQLSNIPAPWEIVGTGDFNGDGKPDILWRNPTTGDNYVWFMNGTTFTGSAKLSNIPNVSAPWEIVGTGDFNSDGKPDILWRNIASGENVVWYMDGITMTGWASLSSAAKTWAIVSLADFNGDGKVDILWRNISTGQNVIWFMDGVTMTDWASLSTVVDPSWKIVG